MQLSELFVVGERQVDVHALQVGPTVTATIKDSVEAFIDRAVVMRPQLHLFERVHPRMHRSRHESGSQLPSQFVDAPNLGLHLVGNRSQCWSWIGGLQLQNMQYQFVRPADVFELDIRDLLPGLELHHLIRDRANVERLGIDKHVLKFDPEGGEQ